MYIMCGEFYYSYTTQEMRNNMSCHDDVYLRPMDGGGNDGQGFGSYFFLGAALIAVALASIAAFS